MISINYPKCLRIVQLEQTTRAWGCGTGPDCKQAQLVEHENEQREWTAH